MKITEHYGSSSPYWTEGELRDLMRLVKDEMMRYEDVEIQMYYGKMYGKLMGMTHETDK